MPSTIRLAAALQHSDASERLRAALSAGSRPDAAFLEPLIARCEVEPDFSVRDTLTWALARLPRELVLPRVIAELASPVPQARSQALHTLSKLGDPQAWAALSEAHLHDPDDEVARTAWRTAAGLVPFEARGELARELSRELGRGGLDLQRSLARALIELGEEGERVAAAAALSDEPRVRAHGAAVLRLFEDPEATFYLDAVGGN